ncbi:MAG: hypothetical protein WC188_04705 [Candidatus Caldatribacteriota bacterium]|nr:hypothetical protein [Patescibacteria group bacterium]
MRIKIPEKQSDFDGPVIDIYFENIKDAFEIGKIFQQICSLDKCVWEGNNHIRLPLIDMTKSGIAIYPHPSDSKKEEKI